MEQEYLKYTAPTAVHFLTALMHCYLLGPTSQFQNVENI